SWPRPTWPATPPRRRRARWCARCPGPPSRRPRRPGVNRTRRPPPGTNAMPGTTPKPPTEPEPGEPPLPEPGEPIPRRPAPGALLPRGKERTVLYGVEEIAAGLIARLPRKSADPSGSCFTEAVLPIHTILHPTDFSERSGYAFQLACALTRDYGARLV